MWIFTLHLIMWKPTQLELQVLELDVDVLAQHVASKGHSVSHVLPCFLCKTSITLDDGHHLANSTSETDKQMNQLDISDFPLLIQYFTYLPVYDPGFDFD